MLVSGIGLSNLASLLVRFIKYRTNPSAISESSSHSHQGAPFLGFTSKCAIYTFLKKNNCYRASFEKKLFRQDFRRMRLGLAVHWLAFLLLSPCSFAACSLVFLCPLFAYPLLFLYLLVALCLPVLCSFFGAALGFHNPLFACSLVFRCCFSALLLLFCWYWDHRKTSK